MARMARVVVAGTPHHVTQRGNRRQTTFFAPCDYELYLAIAAETFAAARGFPWSMPRRSRSTPAVPRPRRPRSWPGCAPRSPPPEPATAKPPKPPLWRCDPP
jgi:hypothetical protein